MATETITGYGEIQLRDTVNNIVFPGGYSEIEISFKNSVEKARRFNAAGKLVITDSYSNDEEYTLKMSMEDFDSLHIGLAMSEVPVVASTGNIYHYVEAIVPTSSPYEVPLLAVTTAKANASSVMVSYQKSGVWNAITTGQKPLNLESTSGTVADGQFKVDTTTVGSEKVTFHSAQAGAPVVISYLDTFTNKTSIGLASAATVKYITSMAFSANLVSDEFPKGFILMCPSLSKTSGFGLKSDKISKLEHEFTINTAAGFRTPFQCVFK